MIAEKECSNYQQLKKAIIAEWREIKLIFFFDIQFEPSSFISIQHNFVAFS